jgi:hypothetical protein
VGIARPLEKPLILNATNAPEREWQTVANGWRIWSASVTSAGAIGIRLHLESVSLPQGARLVVYDPSNPQGRTITVTSKELTQGRDIWAPTIFSEQVVVECQVPPGVDTASASYVIAEVSHMYRLPYSQTILKQAENCEQDVSCFKQWLTDAAGVALIDFIDTGNEFFCTGCLLNSLATSTSASYFLTANHCIHSQASASSIIFYWFYQTSTCNGTPPILNNVPSTVNGGQLLAHSSSSDFSFMSLNQSPPNNVTYLGWSTSAPASGELLTTIHHPRGDFKRLSQGHLNNMDSDFWYVQWSLGVTEPGSSGSPLFNSQHEVIGQLYGGTSDCTNPTGTDNFGRFDVSYLTLSQWLNPSSSIGSAKGTYTGLFSDPAGVNPQSAGAFTLTVASKGAFTGSLQIENTRYSMRGQFSGDGSAETTARHGGNFLDVQLSLNLSNGATQVTGTVSNGTWSANLLGNRSTFNARTNVPQQAAKYTMVVPGNSDPSAAPGGYSYGTVTVDKSGRIRFAGSLADGTPVSQSAALAPDGSWPLYLPLYRSQGLVFSWLSIDNTQGQAVSGDFNWQKPATTNAKYYPAGFTYEAAANGSVYTPPLSGSAVVSSTSAELVLMGGNLAAAKDYPMTFTSTTRLSSTGANKATLTINRSNGLSTGRAVTDQNKSLNLRGVVLQESTNILGYFLGTDESGSVSATAQ